MAVNDALSYISNYTEAYNKTISKGNVSAPSFMTEQSYKEYATNPARCSKNITEEEYAKLMKIIEDGEKNPDPSVRNNAKIYRQRLESLSKMNYEIEYGVSEEAFKSGNKGSYNKRLQEVTNREKELLNQLRELDNASFGEKFMNLFTGKITAKREQIAQELVKVIEMKDRLNSRITYHTIEIDTHTK